MAIISSTALVVLPWSRCSSRMD